MDPLRVYQYAHAGKLIFGPGAVAELKEELSDKGKSLIVTDQGITRAGILKMVTDVFDEAGIKTELYDRVEADPPIAVAEEAAALFRKKKCTSIVGLGGGSSIDTAKAAAALLAGGGTLGEYASGKPITGTLPPLIAIPTTAGTGSEVTPVSVVSDLENRMKLAIRNPVLVPRVALLDPYLIGAIPPRIAAETGADALTHALEAYLSVNGHPITEALASSAIRMIASSLPKFVANARDVEAAGQMLLASCLAGLAFAGAGLGLVHALAHPVGAYFHTGHGLSCALYLPAVMEFNAPACPEKFVAIADALGVNVHGLPADKAAAEAVQVVRDLFARVGLPKTFSEMGIEFRLHPKMVDDACVAPPSKSNPRQAKPEQVAVLFTCVQ